MNSWLTFLMVAVGGAAGAVLRHGVAVITVKLIGRPAWPWQTVAVNWLGCLLIGVLAAAIIERADHPAPMRYLLITGLLGGFTTFSAFALETVYLVETKRLVLAAAYLIATNVGCVMFAFLGLRAVRWLG